MFSCLWIKESLEVSEENMYKCASTYCQEEYVGGADKIRVYKELLDSGVITQKEFETKKREILDDREG